MSGWLPGAGWAPWDALVAAGIRVTGDTRNVSPPCALVTIDRAEIVGACAVQYTVQVRVVAPGPDNADAGRWLWGTGVPPLFPYAVSIQAEDWEGYPTAVALITEGGQQWP